MKRYASHFLFFPGYGYLEQYAIEMEGGHVVRIFPWAEEVESTEWWPGVIALLSKEDAGLPEFGKFRNKLAAVPSGIEAELASFIPFLFFPFDFTTMQPGAGTQRKPLR